MFLNKKTYEDLVAKVEKLAKENKELKSKYEGKISADLNMAKYKKDLEIKSQNDFEAYKKALDSLLEKDLNYALLKQMVNAAQKGTVIDVKSDKGYSITIRREEKPDSNDLDLYGMLGAKS